LVEYIATSGVVTMPPGSSHLKDNSNNTFIGLRILNASMNLAYFEFTDATTDWAFADPNFCEMYPLRISGTQSHKTCVPDLDPTAFTLAFAGVGTTWQRTLTS